MKEIWDSLTDEQKEEAKNCENMDELLKLAGKYRIELPDELLLKCDGEHDLPKNEALKNLTESGLIAPCSKGEHPSDWSQYRKYSHRFVPDMNLMLTGRCNS